MMPQPIRLTIFGSSAGFPTEKRLSTAIGIWRGSELYLVDAGEPIAAHLARRRVSPEALRAVFITHTHADHLAGLPMLIQWVQLNQRKRPLVVCLPAEAVEPVRRLFNLMYLLPELLGFDLELRPIKAGHTYEAAGVVVEAIVNRHVDGHLEAAKAAGVKPARAFSYLITIDGKRLFFSGDLAEASEAGPAQGAELAVIEMAHFTPEELGEALAGLPLPRLVVTHIIHTLEPVEEGIAARIKAAGFEGEVWVARDGDEFEL
jgi:ribonuclease BN (tRNA processing enzyme)